MESFLSDIKLQMDPELVKTPVNIPFCRHSVSEEEIEAVVDTLKSNWLTSGPKTLRFEQEFADYIGSQYAVAVNSCTAALHLALRGYDIKDGDEVITTPMTFCASAEVIEYQRAKPVFVDIDPATFNIDPGRIIEKITPRTKAILPVHYGGIPCEMDEINEIAAAHGLHVIEDAAHALGSARRGKKIGSTGRSTAFSFYPTKNITTGEGGMITTDDEQLVSEYKILSLHGMSKDAWKRYGQEGQWYYEVKTLGYKYNFTDIQAALGMAQLKKLDNFNNIREDQARHYYERIKEIDGIDVPDWYHQYFDRLTDHPDKNNWHLFVIMIDDQKLNVNRNRFIEMLNSKGIGTSVHFIPLHLQPFYAGKYAYQPGDFPQTEATYKRIISIPIYPELSSGEAQYVVDVLQAIALNCRR